MNVRAILTSAESKYADKPLLLFRDSPVSFREFSDLTDGLAAALQDRGVAKGDRVLILAHNSVGWIAAFLATLQCGAIAVPVNPALTASEVRYIVEHSEPKVAFVDSPDAFVSDHRVPHVIALDGAQHWPSSLPHRPQLTSVVAVSETDPAVIFYTSGTTGRPKGVMLSHGAISFIANLVPDLYRLTPSDRTLVCGSLSFIYSIITNSMSAINAGMTIVLLERFHPADVLRTIERSEVTIFMGVPTMYVMMLDWAKAQTVNVPSLRLCICSGSSLPWNLYLRFKERFGLPLFDLWGMTEGTPITSYDPYDDVARPDSCGKALYHCGVRVVDDNGKDVPADTVGEVLLSGPAVMLGYYENPEATAETLKDGWVSSGDLGRLDEDGYLYIVGRKKDLIIRGGANIYPTEVEDVLYGHPGVSECAVIGIPDETFGELVHAVVVPRADHKLDQDDIRTYCRTKLADYKLPSTFSFVASLPKGPTGKILKRKLREEAVSERRPT